ncbi:uncharacterized protein B0H64DRAFT_442130 [Chaetomium fimeti]|uniref:Uncharacterized protein n=1 Tax=Chaetomium fimeti TaxID=1854472 RepID=A0AAE0HFT6_9PEZI|nr:hypothetical protein B0H64DRAFT_442130 [Chaetomium fimeti]
MGTPNTTTPGKRSSEDAASDRFNEFMCERMPSNNSDGVAINFTDLNWRDLTEADERRVHQRITDWVNSPSRLVNLNQVNNRLLDFLARAPSVSRTPSVSSTTTYDSEDELQCVILEETLAYNSLVADGGRPCYRFDLLENVTRAPEEHRDMLRAWGSENDWMVYTKQFHRWKKFRSWQEDNRGILNIGVDFEKSQARHATWDRMRGREPERSDPEWQANHLNMVTNQRKHEHRRFVESGVAKMKGENRFSIYVQAARTRLKRHDFTREFQPAQDHLHQDELTTWIEYLNYEYWAYDKFAARADRLQPEYEQALKDLLGGEVLLPGETIESVVDFHYRLQLNRDKYQAEQAMKNAESNLAARQEALDNTGKDARHLAQDISLKQLQKRLKEAVEAFTALEARDRLIEIFFKAYKPYKLARNKEEAHKLILKWILDQMPLVEAELAERKYATTPGGTRTRRPSHEGNPDGPDSQRHVPRTPTPQEVVPAPEPPRQTHSSSGSKKAPSDADNDNKEAEEAAAKGPGPGDQAVRGAQPASELHEQAVSSTMIGLKRARSDNDNEEESEAPAAKKLKLDAEAVRGHQAGQEIRRTGKVRAPEAENAEAALSHQAARERETQRSTGTGPAAAARRRHQTRLATSRAGQAAGVKTTETLSESVPKRVTRASKKKPAKKPEPKRVQPKRARPKKA